MHLHKCRVLAVQSGLVTLLRKSLLNVRKIVGDIS